MDVVAFAGEHGYEFTADDLAAIIDEVGDELSDFELELVSGGTYYYYSSYKLNTSTSTTTSTTDLSTDSSTSTSSTSSC